MDQLVQLQQNIKDSLRHAREVQRIENAQREGYMTGMKEALDLVERTILAAEKIKGIKVNAIGE